MGLLSKIKEVFTKEYKEETKYQTYMEENVDKMKLANENFDADESIERLKKKEFQNNLHVPIEYEEDEEKKEEEDSSNMYRLNPMMPRKYSAKERQEIRQREKSILERVGKKSNMTPIDMYMSGTKFGEERDKDMEEKIKQSGLSPIECMMKRRHDDYLR